VIPRSLHRSRWRSTAGGIVFIIAATSHGAPAHAALCGYVANEADGTVTIVDLTARQLVDTVAVGNQPSGVAITRTEVDGTVALVVNRADATVSVLSLDRGESLSTLPLTADPAAIDARPDGVAYVVHPNTGTLTSFDVAHVDDATATSLPGRPMAVAVSTTPPLALVPNETDNQLLVVDDAVPPMVHPYRVGTMPRAVAVDPASGLVYVSAKPLTVVDPLTGEVRGTISIPAGGTPSAVTVIANPPTAVLCVESAEGGSVLAVPTDLTQPRTTVQLGAGVEPAAVAGLPSADNLAFVVDRAGDQLLFVDLTAGVVGNVGTGDRPTALAVAELEDSDCWGPIAAPTATPPAGGCPGDCSNDGNVTINELILGVTIALGGTPASECAAFDVDDDGQVVIAELVSAVGAALNGCP
jgi:YVTN family beta-propeller protein